jgi:phage terminase large subunit
VNLVVSTYRDNPFLGKEIREDIERLEATDDQYWKIYGLGEYGKLEGLIFNFLDTIPKEAKFVGRGLDFGFTNDPTALV